MTYDPRQTFQAKQSAFGRASGVTSSKPAVSGGRGSIVEKPGERAAALKKQRDKLVKSQFDQFRRRERNVGLGSRPDTKRRDDDKPQKNFLENLFDRVKSSIIFAGGDPERKRRPDPNPGALYTASPFILPAVTAVATTTLGPAPVGADATGMPSIYTPDTREFGTGIQPMEAPEKPESAKIDIFDPFREKIQRSTAPSGLMSPPQPKDLATTPDMADAINRTIASVTSADPDVPYVIQAGGTLSEIAAKTGTTVDDLQELNAIEDIDVIKTGEQLKIPSARSTKTKEDIVSSIVGDYVKKTGDAEGVEVAALGSGIMGTGLMSKLFGKPDIEGNVDFGFIGELEGAAINKAYIPKKDGKVIAQSGVTVGTGVDLGSKNDAYFKGLSEGLKNKLRPHFGKKKSAAEKSLADKPLILTDAEVKELDTFVKEKELKTLTDRWNKDSDVKFEDLPVNKATAVAATFYQHGNQMFDYNYWKQTTGGDWEAARDNLRNFGDKEPIFQRRRDKEADYLESGEL